MRISNFKYRFFTILIFVVFGCQNPKKNSKPVNEEIANKEASLNAQQIEELNYTQYVLGSKAIEVTQDWLKLQELNSQIEILKKGDLSFFNNENEILSTFFKELKAELPEQLKTNSIEARIVALETSCFKLEGASRLVKMDSQTLLDYVKGVLVAHSNLILQINKKLEKDGQIINVPLS